MLIMPFYFPFPLECSIIILLLPALLSFGSLTLRHPTHVVFEISHALTTFSHFLKQLQRVQKRVADKKMKIEVSDAAIQLLGSLGYDPNYGARPVKRVIQQNVENEIAKGILRGEFKDEDTILIDTEVSAFSNGQLPQQKLVFRRVENKVTGNPNADTREASAQIL